MKEAALETKEGGRWSEIEVDGSECDWGKLLVWDPPRRLVLGLQINAEWQYDPNFILELEVDSVLNVSKKSSPARPSRTSFSACSRDFRITSIIISPLLITPKVVKILFLCGKDRYFAIDFLSI